MHDDIHNRLSGGNDDEIDLLQYCGAVWKRKKMISYLVITIVFCVSLSSLFMTDIYQAKAVVSPVASPQGGVGATLSTFTQQFGGLASLAGIPLPGGSSTSEIVNYLNSQALSEKIIIKYDLLPVLFSKKWNKEKKSWIEPGMLAKSLNRLRSFFIKMIKPGISSKLDHGDDLTPTVWDGLRALKEDVVIISADDKANTITITAEIDDPEQAAKIVTYFLTTLTDHMSSEARRVAEANRKNLEDQLAKAVDPITRQKIYTMLSQQVEIVLMSGVKENFAFKVIDPPKVPDEKIKPRRSFIVILSAFFALFLGVIIAFILKFREKMSINAAADAFCPKASSDVSLTERLVMPNSK